MKSYQKDCAPGTNLIHWKSINWKRVKKVVRSLQLRIAKAIREGRHNKARALQWMLTHSHAAKLLAVKRVTENSGNRTPGVDGIRWNAPIKNSGQPYLYPGRIIGQNPFACFTFSRKTVRKDLWAFLP